MKWESPQPLQGARAERALLSQHSQFGAWINPLSCQSAKASSSFGTGDPGVSEA